MYYLEKCLFKSLAKFLIGLSKCFVFFFFNLGLKDLLIYFGNKLFTWLVAGCLFTLLMCPLLCRSFSVRYICMCLFLLCCLFFWCHTHEIMKQCIFVLWWNWGITYLKCNFYLVMYHTITQGKINSDTVMFYIVFSGTIKLFAETKTGLKVIWGWIMAFATLH